MDTRTIPFTPSQRSTIRTTGLLMLPVGLLWSVIGATAVSKVIALSPMLAALKNWPLATAAIYACAHLVLGLALVLSSVTFLRVARQGTVQALVGGLRALLVVFIIKAAMLLAMSALLLYGLLGMPLLMR